MYRNRNILEASNLRPPERNYGDTLSAYDPFAQPSQEESDFQDITSFSSNFPCSGDRKKRKHEVFDNTAQKLEFEEFMENQEMVLFNKKRQHKVGRILPNGGKINSPASTYDTHNLRVNKIRQQQQQGQFNYRSSRRIIEVKKIRPSLNFGKKNKFRCQGKIEN